MSDSTQTNIDIDQQPVIDQTVLDVLSESVGAEVMGGLVTASVADMRDNARRLLDIAESGDPEEVRAVAHDLKGAAGSFGAMRLHYRAKEVEVACREGRIDDARASIAPVGPAADEAFAALEARFDIAAAVAG